MSKKTTEEELVAAKDNSPEDAAAFVKHILLKSQSEFASVPDDWPTDLFARGARAAVSLCATLGFILKIGPKQEPQSLAEENTWDTVLMGIVPTINRDMRELMHAFTMEYYRVAREATETKIVEVGDWVGRSVGSIVWEVGVSLHSALSCNAGVTNEDGYNPISPDTPRSFRRFRKWADNFSLRDLDKLLVLMPDESDAISARAPKAPPNPAYLGIILNRHSITRNGHDRPPIELSDLQLAICEKLIEAGDLGLSTEEINNLPGEATAKDKAISTLRELLSPFDLTISDGRGRKRRRLVEFKPEQ